MARYYKGDLEKDLATIDQIKSTPKLNEIGRVIGFGRAQKVLGLVNAVKAGDMTHEEAVLAANYHPTYYQPLVDIYENVGYQYSVFILQVLWAKWLKGKGIALMGALGLDDFHG